MRYLAACGLLLAVSAPGAEIDVRATAGGRVSLKVNAAPLSEVLDRLARQTGMKVVYDGAPPRALVRGRGNGEILRSVRSAGKNAPPLAESPHSPTHGRYRE